MKLTITNGNARNGVYGQRLRLEHRSGATHDILLPGRAITSKKWRPMIRFELLSHLRVEALRRHAGHYQKAGARAADMINLFAEGKARLMIDHNRRSIGHA